MKLFIRQDAIIVTKNSGNEEEFQIEDKRDHYLRITKEMYCLAERINLKEHEIKAAELEIKAAKQEIINLAKDMSSLPPPKKFDKNEKVEQAEKVEKAEKANEKLEGENIEAKNEKIEIEEVLDAHLLTNALNVAYEHFDPTENDLTPRTAEYELIDENSLISPKPTSKIQPGESKKVTPRTQPGDIKLVVQDTNQSMQDQVINPVINPVINSDLSASLLGYHKRNIVQQAKVLTEQVSIKEKIILGLQDELSVIIEQYNALKRLQKEVLNLGVAFFIDYNDEVDHLSIANSKIQNGINDNSIKPIDFVFDNNLLLHVYKKDKQKLEKDKLTLEKDKINLENAHLEKVRLEKDKACEGKEKLNKDKLNLEISKISLEKDKENFDYAKIIKKWARDLLATYKPESQTFEEKVNIINNHVLGRERLKNTINFIKDNYVFNYGNESFRLHEVLKLNKSTYCLTSGRIGIDTFVFRTEVNVTCFYNTKNSIRKIFYLNDKDEIAVEKDSDLLVRVNGNSERSSKPLLKLTLETKVVFDASLKPDFSFIAHLEYNNNIIQYSGIKLPFMQVNYVRNNQEFEASRFRINPFYYLFGYGAEERKESIPALGIDRKLPPDKNRIQLHYYLHKFPAIKLHKVSNSLIINTFIMNKNTRIEESEKKYTSLMDGIQLIRASIADSLKMKKDLENLSSKSVAANNLLFSNNGANTKSLIDNINTYISGQNSQIAVAENKIIELFPQTPTLPIYTLLNDAMNFDKALEKSLIDFRRSSYYFEDDTLIFHSDVVTPSPALKSNKELMDKLNTLTDLEFLNFLMERWSSVLIKSSNKEYNEENKKKVTYSLLRAIQQSFVLDPLIFTLKQHTFTPPPLYDQSYPLAECAKHKRADELILGIVGNNKVIYRKIIDYTVLQVVSDNNSAHTIYYLDDDGELISSSVAGMPNRDLESCAYKTTNQLPLDKKFALFSIETTMTIEFDGELNPIYKHDIQLKYQKNLFNYVSSKYDFIYSQEEKVGDGNFYNFEVVDPKTNEKIHKKHYFPVEKILAENKYFSVEKSQIGEQFNLIDKDLKLQPNAKIVTSEIIDLKEIDKVSVSNQYVGVSPKFITVAFDYKSSCSQLKDLKSEAQSNSNEHDKGFKIIIEPTKAKVEQHKIKEDTKTGLKTDINTEAKQEKIEDPASNKTQAPTLPNLKALTPML